MHLAPSRLPVHLIPKTFLMDVAPSAYRSKTAKPSQAVNGSTLNARFFADFFSARKSAQHVHEESETLHFKVGGWVNLPIGFRQPISLLLVFHDRNGEQAILIDEMDARGASEVLLSGEVEINGCGIDAMSLYCGGICDKAVWANNLTIKRIEPTAETGNSRQRLAG